MTEAPSSIGIIVTAEQIPLLRDIIVAQHLDVYISDTQNTLLLDDQWKPWIRRVKPQRTHCTAAVWLMAPNYSWPDYQSHPRIRDIIATQLQSCIHMAVMLGATGLVLPIEHAQPAFIERLTYYLNLIDDQLTVHELSLRLAVSNTADVNDIVHLCQQLPNTYSLLMGYEHTHTQQIPISEASIYTEISITEDDEAAPLSTGTHHIVIGGHENISLIRQKVQWTHTQLTLRANSPDPLESTDSSPDIEPQASLPDADDELV